MGKSFSWAEALAWLVFLILAFGAGAAVAKRKNIAWPPRFLASGSSSPAQSAPATESPQTQTDVGFMPAVQIHVGRQKRNGR